MKRFYYDKPNRQDTIGIQFLPHNHDWPVCIKQVISGAYNTKSQEP